MLVPSLTTSDRTKFGQEACQMEKNINQQRVGSNSRELKFLLCNDVLTYGRKRNKEEKGIIIYS